jgi:hypothetical protein
VLPIDIQREEMRVDDMYKVRFPDSYLPDTAEIIRRHTVALNEMPHSGAA